MNEALQKSVKLVLFQLTFNRSFGVVSVHVDLKNSLSTAQFDVRNIAKEVYEGQHGKRVKDLLGPSEAQITQSLDQGLQWLKRTLGE